MPAPAEYSDENTGILIGVVMSKGAIKAADVETLRKTAKWSKPLMAAGWNAIPSIIIEKQAALGLDAIDMNHRPPFKLLVDSGQPSAPFCRDDRQGNRESRLAQSRNGSRLFMSLGFLFGKSGATQKGGASRTFITSPALSKLPRLLPRRSLQR
jgi:hypothetical protein